MPRKYLRERKDGEDYIATNLNYNTTIWRLEYFSIILQVCDNGLLLKRQMFWTLHIV